MTSSLVRRVRRIEESARRPIRARLSRIMVRMGASLPPAEVDGIVSQALGWPARIAELRARGLSSDQIMERLAAEGAR